MKQNNPAKVFSIGIQCVLARYGGEVVLDSLMNYLIQN